MNNNGNDQRRALFAETAETGALELVIHEAAGKHTQFVIIIAATNSQPGSGFLQRLMNCPKTPLDHRRQIREVASESQSVNIASPASDFLLLADAVDPSVAAAVRAKLRLKGVVPVVVMAAGGVMTCSVLPIDDPDTFQVPEFLKTHKGPIDLFSSAPHESDAAQRARQHRDDRRRKHGMN